MVLYSVQWLLNITLTPVCDYAQSTALSQRIVRSQLSPSLWKRLAINKMSWKKGSLFVSNSPLTDCFAFQVNEIYHDESLGVHINVVLVRMIMLGYAKVSRQLPLSVTCLLLLKTVWKREGGGGGVGAGYEGASDRKLKVGGGVHSHLHFNGRKDPTEGRDIGFRSRHRNILQKSYKAILLGIQLSLFWKCSCIFMKDKMYQIVCNNAPHLLKNTSLMNSVLSSFDACLVVISR